jgi:hypothetical protein
MAKTIRTARKQVTPPHVINDRIQKREIARLKAELEDSRQLNDFLEEEMRELLERLAQAREMLKGGFEALEGNRRVSPPLSEDSVNKNDDETEEEDPSEESTE